MHTYIRNKKETLNLRAVIVILLDRSFNKELGLVLSGMQLLDYYKIPLSNKLILLSKYTMYNAHIKYNTTNIKYVYGQ